MKKQILTLCCLSTLAVGMLAGCQKETAETTMEETTESQYVLEDETLRTLAEDFGKAVIEKDYRTALSYTGNEDTSFISDEDFEDYLNSVETLSPLLSYTDVTTWETDVKDAVYSQEYTSTSNNDQVAQEQGALQVRNSGVIIYGTQIDEETATINISDFITNDWKIEIPKGSTLVLDGVEVNESYIAPDDMQINDSEYQVYLIPAIGMNVEKAFQLTVNGEVVEGSFITRGFMDATYTRITADGTIEYTDGTNVQSVEEIDAIYQNQQESSTYEIPNDASMMMGEDGTMVVQEADGTTVILDEDGNVISTIEENAVESE